MKRLRNLGFRKLLLVALIGCLVVTVVGCGSSDTPEETYEWKIAQPYPEGTLLYQTVEDFIDRVDQKSDGRIELTHYPGTLLGDYTAQQEAIAAGSQEMAFLWPSTKMNPKWDLAKLGFIYYNWEQAYEALQPGGWLESLRDDIAEETNWKLLASCPGSSMNIIANELFDITDPGGLKIRVQSNQVIHDRWDIVGFSPVNIPFSEVSTALTTGTIDASSGCATAEFPVFGEAFKYVYVTSDMFSATPLVMNLDLWKSLSSGDQQILLDASKEATDAAWSKQEADLKKNWNGLLDWQVVVTLDGDTWSTIAQKCREQEWTNAESLIGKDLVDVVRANAEPLPWGMTIDEMNYGFDLLTTDWILGRQDSVVTGP